MENFGVNLMLSFCGQDKCSVDTNGRLKLSPRVLTDFEEACSGNVVLHCLPEGTIAVYPEETFLLMRKSISNPAEKAAGSMVFRRSLRMFGALSQPQTITKQGRLTLPTAYRDFAELNSGAGVVVVGVEIGVEIWNADKWAEELKMINDHMMEKGMREMEGDLAAEM